MGVISTVWRMESQSYPILHDILSSWSVESLFEECSIFLYFSSMIYFLRALNRR